jgi:hypothetical protein
MGKKGGKIMKQMKSYLASFLLLVLIFLAFGIVPLLTELAVANN